MITLMFLKLQDDWFVDSNNVRHVHINFLNEHWNIPEGVTEIWLEIEDRWGKSYEFEFTKAACFTWFMFPGDHEWRVETWNSFRWTFGDYWTLKRVNINVYYNLDCVRCGNGIVIKDHLCKKCNKKLDLLIKKFLLGVNTIKVEQ